MNVTELMLVSLEQFLLSLHICCWKAFREEACVYLDVVTLLFEKEQLYLYNTCAGYACQTGTQRPQHQTPTV